MASNMWLKTILICLYLGPYFFSGVNAKPNVIELDEDNWERMMTNEWMVEFYAPWCPACKALQPVWEEFSSWSEDLDIEVGQVDVTESPGLSGRFMVTALPTIFHVLNGEFRQYRGAREKEAFISFVEDKKWKSIDAIPGWKSPGSLQMSVVSYFFKLSQLLRTIHNILMEDYGLPTWGPYIIFALATIFIGALLGLILVCIIDFIYPPKPLVLSASESAKGAVKAGGDKFSGDEMDDGDGSMFVQDDLVDEIAAESESESEPKEESGSPSVRKRKLRKAD